MTLLAFESCLRSGSVTTQSSFTQPGSSATSSHFRMTGSPSRTTSSCPARTSSTVQVIGGKTYT